MTSVIYCASCLKNNVRTPVEKYRAQDLGHCTLHYWLMHGRKQGYTFDSYTESSSKQNFIVSFPETIGDEDLAAPVYCEHRWPGITPRMTTAILDDYERKQL